MVSFDSPSPFKEDGEQFSPGKYGLGLQLFGVEALVGW
jgi:hypothetical protein